MPPAIAKKAPPPPLPSSLPPLPYEVSPACHRDVPALVHVFLASAASGNSETVDVDAGEREGWARALSEHMADASVRLLKLTATRQSGGGAGGGDSILGWALWSINPLPPAEDDSESGPGSSGSESVLSSAPGSDSEMGWGGDEGSEDSEDVYTAVRGLKTPPPGQPRERCLRPRVQEVQRGEPARSWPPRGQHDTPGPIHWRASTAVASYA